MYQDSNILKQDSGCALRLRAVEPEDADFMYMAESDPDAWKYSDYISPLSRELLRQYALTYDADPLRSGQLRLIIEKDYTPIGIADLFEISSRHLRAETGIFLLPEFRGQKLGQKVLTLLLTYAGERLGMHQLTATISENNHPAISAFRSVGYQETGRRPEWLRTRDGFEDVIIFSCII